MSSYLYGLSIAKRAIPVKAEITVHTGITNRYPFEDTGPAGFSGTLCDFVDSIVLSHPVFDLNPY